MHPLVQLLTERENAYFYEVSLLSIGISVHPMSWISLLHYHIIIFYLLDIMFHDHSLYFLLSHNISKSGLRFTFFPISFFSFSWDLFLSEVVPHFCGQ